MSDDKKKSKALWYIIGTIIVLGILFFVYNYVVNLEKQLQNEKQNLAYTNDSLKIARTKLGFVSEKYVNIISDNDSIAKAYEEQGKELAVLQNVNLQLKLELQSDTTTVDTLGGSLTAVFSNTQSDSGLIIWWRDSVIFWRTSLFSSWQALNFPSVQASMWYRMIITRDENGLLSGALETFSPSLTTMKLDTKIVDNYVPPLPAMSGPNIFAITAGGNYYYGNVGLLLRLGRWAFNPSYNLILNTGAEDISLAAWYKRLDIRVAYFIW